ncbi:MAG: deoxyribonuclease V [Nitrospirae bacterium]|nr:deoxyribonuclease V [Nitrospirota bacterium]
MKIRTLHPWTLTPKDAIALQRRLVNHVVTENQLGAVRFVAGADIATYKDSPDGYAGVVVMSSPGLEIVETASATVKLTFPYIPGLLAFRELPVLLEAFAKLTRTPDLILVDGQGLAHPRRFGIACHLGLLLDLPTIGCAKSRLFGRHEAPPLRKSGVAHLYDEDDHVIGAAVRTKDRTNPIYVSIGHKIDLPTAIRYTLACGRGYRVPEPTRQAHFFVGRLRQEERQDTNK